MSKIECYLFGPPKIIEDGKDVYIPMGKVSGVLFYLLIKKHSNRDELSSIFWPSSNEDRAKTSLRNALHKLRKLFSQDLILTPNKSTVIINEDINILLDVNEFEKDPIENNHLYTDDFLKGFYVSDSIGFDDWALELRSYYKKCFINNIEQNIIYKFNNNEFEDLENDIYRLINTDNFNEVGHLYLMKYFQSIDRYDKIINEYHKYRSLLEEELGVEPTEQIQDIYKKASLKIKESIIDKKLTVTRYLYNREFELNLIQENLDSFKRGDLYKSMLVTGESGVGKTVLINELLENNASDFKILKVKCYGIEKNFSYSPWIKLIREIDEEFTQNNNLSRPQSWNEVLNNYIYDGGKNLQPSVQIFEFRERVDKNLLHNSLLSAFENISNDKKIIVVIEDIQWIDKFSTELLNNLILHANRDTLFIISMSEEMDRDIYNDFNALIKLNKLINIKLKLFDKRETANIIKRSLNREIPQKDIDHIYRMSKGNAFFLAEYINLYKDNKSEGFLIDKINNVLYEKFDDLTELEQDILNMLSVYYGEMSIDFLSKSLDKKAFEILKSINNLVRRKIIDEKKIDGQIYIVFSYNAYQKYIYNNLNDSFKQILHREVARGLENELLYSSGHITSYIEIQYHYSRSNEPVNTLKYEVNILNYYLNFSHEVYPTMSNYDASEELDYILNDAKALEWINNVELKISRGKDSCKTKEDMIELEGIELVFFYCKGRHLIRCGNYNEGTKVMRRVIDYAKDMRNKYIELSGHKQMIIYGIQINDSKIMLNHIIPGIKVAKRIKSYPEQGVLYRLYGLYYIMKGDFNSAEKLLNRSLDMFNNSSSIGTDTSISIAAVYNYLGEIRSAELRYKEAMEFYHTAIDKCDGIEATCLAIFYINAGKTSFLTGDHEGMKKYLTLARKIVKQFDSYWKTPVLDAIFSLMLFLEEKYDESIQYLQLAKTELNIINNPRDKGMVYFIETILAYRIYNSNKPEYDKLREYINNEPEVYYYNAIKNLDGYRDRAEIEYIGRIILER